MQFHYADPAGAVHPVFVCFEGVPVLADPQDSAAEPLRDGWLWSISVGEDDKPVVAVLVGVADRLVE